jgi:Tol biopolymer transport system component/class 3 adenylate cyclase
MPELEDSGSKRTLEIAHVLFMDIVAYSQLPMDEQTRLIEKLQQIVRNTTEFSRAQKRRQLLRLPTGDGMALVFFGDAEAPVRCALEISRAGRDLPDLRLRMGIHTGPVQRVEDINAARNVAGGGINIAQRVMDCGDAGHILISKTVADVLDQVSTWKTAFHDLGEAEVKHAVRVHLYNLYTDEAGNRELPQKLRTVQTMAATARSQSKRKKASLGAVTGVIAVLAVAGIVWTLYYWLAPKPVPFQEMEISQLTTNGKISRAAISPDGRYVAYVTNESGPGKEQESLWVKQIVSGSDMQIAARADGAYLGLTFSRDGDFIYAVKTDPKDTDSNSLYKMPVLGGTARKLIFDVDSNVTLSPDGKQLAFVRNSEARNESALMLANGDGSDEKQLAVHKWTDGFENVVAWSPNGKTIATAVDNTEAGVQYASLVEFPVQSKVERSLTPRRWSVFWDLAWVSDDRGLIVNAVEHPGGGLQIGYLSYRNGDFRRITNDLNGYFGVSLSSDSHALATVHTENSYDAWAAPLAEADTAKPITSGGQTYWATLSPDGRIVFMKSGNIWVMESDGRNPRQVTVKTGGADILPRVSPDGRYIVFVSSGDNHIWRIDMDGNNAKQLTNSPLDSPWPDFSPDGKWVVYTKVGAEKGVWKVPIEGGSPVRLNDASAYAPVISPDGRPIAPVISPDGRWIAYSSEDKNATPKRGVAIMAFDGGSPTRRVEVVTDEFHWDGDGSSLLYTKNKGGVGNIWRQPIAGGAPTQVTHFVSDEIYSFDVSRDGKRLLMGRGRQTSDAVLIRDLR